MLSTDPFQLVGTIVDGRYRVDAIAGQGGHGVVYRAFHLTFESAIALKVLKLSPYLTSAERKVKISDFRREGKVLFELSGLHASIVKAFESGVITSHDGATHPYLALEWLEGKSLDREIKCRREKQLPPMALSEIHALLDGVAEALALAHARGIAHRDIKPGNLFAAIRGARQSIKLLDFGIAKILDDSLTMTGHLTETIGGGASSFTPMYAAPEQWLRRLGATGPWTDVHAWALVCVELMTGKFALAGDEPAHLMAACLDSSSRPTPRTLGCDVSDEVEAVFSRSLALHPDERFRDLGAFWKAFAAAISSAPKSAGEVVLHSLAAPSVPDSARTGLEGPSGSPASAPSASRTPTATTVDRHSSRRRAKRSRPPWLAVVGIGVLGILAAFSSRKSAPSAEEGPAKPADIAISSASAPLPTSIPMTPPILSIEPSQEPVEPPVQPAASAQYRKVSPRIETLPSSSASRASLGSTAEVAQGQADISLEREVSAPNPARMAYEPFGTKLPPRLSSNRPLDQLIENEELADRR